MTSIPLPVFPQNPVSVSNRILSRPQKRTQTAALWAVFCCLLFPFAPRPSAGSGRLGVDERKQLPWHLRWPARSVWNTGNIRRRKRSRKPLGASSWTDSSGNLWLFGGYGVDANGLESGLNDLWEFNPSTNEWAWMGGAARAAPIPV